MDDESEAEPRRARLLRSLKKIATERTLSRGQSLFHQGDPAEALHVLESGLLEISTLADDGRKLALNLLRPGAVFGEVAVFEGGVRSATVTALQESRVIQVARAALISEIRRDPDFALDMVRLAVERMTWISRQLEDHAFQPLGIRLARRMLWLMRTVGEDDVLTMAQGELAEHVGATREAVSKVLADWKRRQIIDIGRGQIVLRDPEALRRLSAPALL